MNQLSNFIDGDRHDERRRLSHQRRHARGRRPPILKRLAMAGCEYEIMGRVTPHNVNGVASCAAAAIRRLICTAARCISSAARPCISRGFLCVREYVLTDPTPDRSSASGTWTPHTDPRGRSRNGWFVEYRTRNALSHCRTSTGSSLRCSPGIPGAQFAMARTCTSSGNAGPHFR